MSSCRRSTPSGLETVSRSGETVGLTAVFGPAPMAARNPATSCGTPSDAAFATRRDADTTPFHTARWLGSRTISLSLGVRANRTAAACSAVSSCGPAGSCTAGAVAVAGRSTASGRSTGIGASGSNRARIPASSTCSAGREGDAQHPLGGRHLRVHAALAERRGQAGRVVDAVDGGDAAGRDDDDGAAGARRRQREHRQPDDLRRRPWRRGARRASRPSARRSRRRSSRACRSCCRRASSPRRPRGSG